MAAIQIIVGSVMGTAQGVAEYLERTLGGIHDVRINNSASCDDLAHNSNELFIFCTSNTGSGDLPENIAPLCHALRTTPPNIARCQYGLINLGDSAYPTFGEAGHTLDGALQNAGAQRLHEMLTIDASAERYPQKSALAWAEALITKFEQ